MFENDNGPTLGGRPETLTAAEYFAQREQDTRAASSLSLRPNSAFRSERPGSVSLDWKRRIAPDIQVEPRRESVERNFRSLFIFDIEENASTISIRAATSNGFGAKFSPLGRSRTDYLLNKIGERAFSSHFSRALVEDSYLKNEAAHRSQKIY